MYVDEIISQKIQNYFLSWVFVYYFNLGNLPFVYGSMILFKPELGFQSCSS